MIKLEEVTPLNWRIDLKVAKKQKDFVADKTCLLARAYAYRNSRSKAFIIYNDTVPVGMALYYDIDDMQAYDFSQFFIDEKYQRKGYGLEAAKQILQLMKADGKYDKVYLCYIDGNKEAETFYKKLGFTPTGECDDDEIVMEKTL